MYQKIVLVIGISVLCYAASAQINDITRVLLEIQQNNKELQAFASRMEGQQFELRAENNLPDPQVGFYYLPWGEHSSGDYNEFQISQSFEFPRIYVARKELIIKQISQLELELILKKQEVLLPVQNYCIELIYLNKRIKIEEARVDLAEKILRQVELLYDKGQVGILEINKAKIAWMQERFNVEKIENDKRNILLTLQNLNGGMMISFDQNEFLDNLQLPPLDSIWNEKKLKDPEMKILRKKEEIALQLTQLIKYKSVPNITAGFNYQGVAGANYSGIYGGLTIPIWSNRHKVKAKNVLYNYQKSQNIFQSNAAYAKHRKLYNDYHMLMRTYHEFQKNLMSLNSDGLLFKAYELGEISFMEYYLEMHFYHQAYDAMLDMEKQLNRLKSEILRHQL
jgi:cobalt-zinc-cadmium efflux system outer membrane protein